MVRVKPDDQTAEPATAEVPGEGEETPPVEPEVVVEDQPVDRPDPDPPADTDENQFFTILDEEGELKEVSVIRQEIGRGWNKVKARLAEAFKEPLKELGKEAAVEAATRMSKTADGALDGMAGDRPKKGGE